MRVDLEEAQKERDFDSIAGLIGVCIGSFILGFAGFFWFFGY